MLLEINTNRSKLGDFVDKIVKAKLGMNLPIIMHGSALLYEAGDDLDDDMVAIYSANLEKVVQQPLCEITLSSPFINPVLNIFFFRCYRNSLHQSLAEACFPLKICNKSLHAR